MPGYGDLVSGRPTARTVFTFVLLHIAIFLLIFIPLSQLFYYGPGAMELSVAQEILNGGVPYRDFMSEYPPLALLSFFIPALISNANLAYGLLFAGEMLLLDLAIVYMIADIVAHIEMPVTPALTVYTLLLLAVGPIMVARYDLLPAALVVAALWAFIKGKNILCWLFIALGVTAKIYPLIIAPAFGLYLLRNYQFRTLIKGVAAFSAAMLAGNLPFFLMDPVSFASIVTYHSLRGIQCESTYASLTLVWQILGGPDVEGVFNFGSWNLTSPFADELAKIALPLTAVLLVAMYAVFFWILWKRTERTEYLSTGLEPDAAKPIIACVTLSIAIFMIGNKVFSPQFLIWLIPTMPLLNQKWQPVYTLLFITIGALTQFIFPYKYIEYGSFLTPYVLILALRNLLVIFFAGLVVVTTGARRESPDYRIERVLVAAGEHKEQ